MNVIENLNYYFKYILKNATKRKNVQLSINNFKTILQTKDIVGY